MHILVCFDWQATAKERQGRVDILLKMAVSRPITAIWQFPSKKYEMNKIVFGQD
jgi:hypothetical protein